MDWSSILVAGLAMIGTLIGSFLSNSKTQALIGYRIDQLERKVEKHNTIVERTYKLENDMKTAFTRVDEIRAEVHDLQTEKDG